MIADIDDAEWTWSPGSDGLSPLTLAPHIRTLLGSELVGKDGTKVPVEALAGKVVGKSLACIASYVRLVVGMTRG